MHWNRNRTPWSASHMEVQRHVISKIHNGILDAIMIKNDLVITIGKKSKTSRNSSTSIWVDDEKKCRKNIVKNFHFLEWKQGLVQKQMLSPCPYPFSYATLLNKIYLPSNLFLPLHKPWMVSQQHNGKK